MKVNRRAALAVLPLALLCALVSCKHGGSGKPSSGAAPVGPAPPGDQPAFPFAEHVDQGEINTGAIPFVEAFALGDALFETQFNDLDGVGALRLPDGSAFPQRFSRVPPGGGRVTGPNAQACVGCHNSPFETSAGEAAANVLQDPGGLGQGPFNPRNTISLFAAGVPQRLAEEMTEELSAIKAAVESEALPGGPFARGTLVAKGISFGEIAARRTGAGALLWDLSGIEGVDTDLVVRPYGWKGNQPTLRGFCRAAGRNELGMEAEELVEKESSVDGDPDGDGVAGELSVGDITAITIYVAAQEIPQPLERLVREGLAPPPTVESARLIARGEALFSTAGCANCHVPELHLSDPVFEEPTRRGGGNYFDPDVSGIDPDRPLRFHLVREGDQPRLEPHPSGGARVRLFGDLKRHNMGVQLADPEESSVVKADGSDLEQSGIAVTVPRSVFLTPELWGVGNSGPWLHDGRSGSLEDAILLHGVNAPPPTGDPDRSEAQESRDAFGALSPEDRLAVVEFLRSLVHFQFTGAEE